MCVQGVRCRGLLPALHLLLRRSPGSGARCDMQSRVWQVADSSSRLTAGQTLESQVSHHIPHTSAGKPGVWLGQLAAVGYSTQTPQSM